MLISVNLMAVIGIYLIRFIRIAIIIIIVVVINWWIIIIIIIIIISRGVSHVNTIRIWNLMIDIVGSFN